MKKVPAKKSDLYTMDRGMRCSSPSPNPSLLPHAEHFSNIKEPFLPEQQARQWQATVSCWHPNYPGAFLNTHGNGYDEDGNLSFYYM